MPWRPNELTFAEWLEPGQDVKLTDRFILQVMESPPKNRQKTTKIQKNTKKLPQMYRNIAVREHQQKQQIPVRKTCAAKLAMEYGVFHTIFKRESGTSQENWPKLPPQYCFGVKSTNEKTIATKTPPR